MTTIVDMPLNSIPPVTSVDAIHAKVAAMREKCRVDVALWGGAVPGNASQFAAMLDEGVVGFKCFLVDSGVPEFGHLDALGLDEAMAALRKTNAPLPGPRKRNERRPRRSSSIGLRDRSRRRSRSRFCI